MKRLSDKINTTSVILAVTCVILLVALIVAVAYWDSSNSAYINLQSQTSVYVNDHSHTNEDYESLKSTLENAQSQLSTSNNQSTVSQLQDQVNSLQNQLAVRDDFNNSTTLLDKTGTLSTDYSTLSYTVDHSGIVHVTVQSNSNASMSISWSLDSYSYDQTSNPTQNPSLSFPILASSSAPTNFSIIISFQGSTSGVSATEDMTYTY